MKTSDKILIFCVTAIAVLFLAVCLMVGTVMFQYYKSPDYDRIINYEQLPADVQEKFKSVYDFCEPTIIGNDTIPYFPEFVEVHNLNGDSVAIKKSILAPFGFGNTFYIHSGGKKFETGFYIIERVYIIKNDSIYFPINGEGISCTGVPRSEYVRIDTLKFAACKMFE